MPTRITEAHLSRLLNRLNKITKAPETPQGQRPVPGVYYLDYAYGGVSLRQILKTGGERSVFNMGYHSKRGLYECMHAYIEGIHDGREGA